MQKLTLDEARKIFENHLPAPITGPEVIDTDVALRVDWLLSDPKEPARCRKPGLAAQESSLNS